MVVTYIVLIGKSSEVQSWSTIVTSTTYKLIELAPKHGYIFVEILELSQQTADWLENCTIYAQQRTSVTYLSCQKYLYNII